MNTYTTLMLFVTNVICLGIGFMLGSEHEDEVVQIVTENEWHQHCQSALWVARRTA